MDTSKCKEQPKKQGDIERRREVKDKEAGNRNSSTESVNSQSGSYNQIYIPLG
jgi:hypothetical protein